MAMMDSFDHILNWRLKQGSHTFPGQDGGTCINEAAIVAAGFPYQPVRTVEDMPACFSRPICQLAMELNDEADDVERQRLLPFVTRLACADTPEIEQIRADHIQRLTCGYPYGIPFEVGLKALEGALAIGRQADPFAPDEVKARMEAARAETLARTAILESAPSTPNKSLFSVVKDWLKAKETA